MSQGKRKDVVIEGRDRLSLENRDVILRSLDHPIRQAQTGRGSEQLLTTTMTATENALLGGIKDEIWKVQKSQEAKI